MSFSIFSQSLDMSTISDPVSATTFVKEPNVQQTTQTREIPKSMIIAPENNIKDIQDYLKSDDVNNLIGKKYNGPIDGKINEELINTAKLVELTISKTINKNIDGIILKTTAKDIEKSVKKILAFKKIFETKQVKISQDQRIYELGKLKMIKK